MKIRTKTRDDKTSPVTLMHTNLLLDMFLYASDHWPYMQSPIWAVRPTATANHKEPNVKWTWFEGQRTP